MKEIFPRHGFGKKNWLSRLPLFWLAALLAAGCSSSKRRILREPPEEMLPPQPIAFLTGPAAALLTNSTGFSARITIDPPLTSNSVHGFTGQLLGQGSHLLLAPAAGDRLFIWDVAAHEGYVLSDSLQGYAPISSSIHVVNLSTISETAGPASQKVNGQRGHEAEVRVVSNDGSTNRYRLWRTADFAGFPVRIEAVNDPVAMVVNLSNFKLEVLKSNLFLPPDGFIRYAKPKTMADELMARKSKMRNGLKDDSDDLPEGVSKRPAPAP